MAQQSWKFSKGLHETGNGVYAYLQPDGSWGWSNAGLIVDSGESLLVDTLFDAPLTHNMLKTMQSATGVGADAINVVVNTHANGDHTHGNGLCCNAEIIASQNSAREMSELPAEVLAEMIEAAPALGIMGKYLVDIFGNFDFRDVAERLPTKTFCGHHDMLVGDKKVELIEVGPAHTQGDVIVNVPHDRTVYTGDILFIDGTPIMWAGPVANWIAACEKIIDLDPEVVVPGHGPITDVNGVREVQSYLHFIDTEARQRYDAGLTVQEAAHDIALGDYSAWMDAERIAVNVSTLYREYSGNTEPPDIINLFTLMAEMKGYSA